ncbi:MAG: iron-sulfur cluster assembly accessory protein [Xanthomonadales bacterium]|nr:iron-sulfur cluster assembly accessory protein [Xanthomonadales bacterium]NIN74542.1 iron-sulfur cluster assembly accessory protein [Xanthomonadales bacterium]NIP11590.1 iron-sulfur cluster assembly accessory protein [Xanthomonadales bacterium]NIP76254.1 iron-sulfur cluster assembly accessory protein [Xanthomonadales bacterium]NIT07855.1 iron-sulfur cluster assembly accessory protein [Xanthomonadales bacterium]
MAITLTETAARRVRYYLDKDGGAALRLGVRKTGCSGWAYTVTLSKSIGPEDVVFEDRGVKVVVDPDSLPYLDGSRIDFTADGLNRTFQFDNPNATEECGCGESFTID